MTPTVLTTIRVVEIEILSAEAGTRCVGITAAAVALADAGINIQMISTSEIKITIVISGDQLEEAVKTLHSAFNLGD